MDIDLSNLDEKKRFDVKLQISLYKTALKVFREDKKKEFESYMNERFEKIRELLDIEVQEIRIFEDGKLLIEVHRIDNIR